MGQTHYPSKKSLRASSLSKLDNMVNSNSIFMRRCAKFSTKWFEILNFNKPTCIYKHPYNLHQKSIPSFQPIFTSLFSLTCSENHPYNPHKHSLFQYLGNFSSFFSLAQASLESLHKAYFQRTDSVLVSAFFLKYEKKKQGSQSLFLYRSGSNNWCIACSSLSTQSILTHTLILLSLFPDPSNTMTRTKISLETSCFT